MTIVLNHPFRPGDKVGFYPPHLVEAERQINREPAPDPTATATVADDGTLEVKGLEPGPWMAAAPSGKETKKFYDHFNYFRFPVE